MCCKRHSATRLSSVEAGFHGVPSATAQPCSVTRSWSRHYNKNATFDGRQRSKHAHDVLKTKSWVLEMVLTGVENVGFFHDGYADIKDRETNFRTNS